MMSLNSIGRFTNFHDSKQTFLEPQYDLKSSFTDKILEMHRNTMMFKVAMITVASAGFGLIMGIFMGSFEYNMNIGVDTSKSGWSQVRQHYFGYWRYLKRQALHFSRFGLYIGLIDIPLEIVVGKQNWLTMAFGAGMAGWLQHIRSPFIPTFMGTGAFVGCIGLYMNKGEDK